MNSARIVDAAHNVAWSCAVRGDQQCFRVLCARLRAMGADDALAQARATYARFGGRV